MRRIALRIAESIGLVLALPLFVAWRLRLLTFATGGQLLSLVPGDVGMLIRRGWYRLGLEECGRHLTVEFGSVIHRPAACIGNDCYIGEYNRIGLVEIGDDFMSSSHVAIVSGMRPHGFNRRDIPVRLQPASLQKVSIGTDVWVGVGAIIGADVAAHSIVGSGTVITKTFDEWQILGGVPGVPIGNRP
jgi:virginiamycin A acetyltransferase